MILASQMWTQVFWTSAIAGGLLAGLPLMFTALGESISERAGVLNIGLEGMMLVGAYCGFLGAYYGGSQWYGYLAGIAAGVLSSLFMVVLCVWLGLDQIVVGIALSLSTLLQIAGINLSPEVVNILPFAAIIVALMVFARRAYLPPALALPYVRGAR